ncbi:DUF3883 domain-containing protein [Halorubellus sp. PRR65]|uniref:sacsin N-terminal ATP-binding-like domain-containing protein n=1 Tax=Halorubellus sp. PRR65 TaxID=3098148 RepID=UPI002B2637B2|nr:DUF3883 domain-containing protein [Halorubellus sp. PRR65]
MSLDLLNDSEFLSGFRQRRLSSYRSTPEDINAHYSDEGQIQADYHRRFAFELIQNADDAMSETAGERKVRFELNGNTLLVANTGRAIDEEDVKALCTMSYTTKDASSEDDQEAPIGHKGRGFSSVLDLTNRPQVFSTGISFEFDRDESRESIFEVVDEHDNWSQNQIDGIPLMRLPYSPDETPSRVEALLEQGYNTVFRFDLKSADIRKDAITAISELDEHTAVFLQNLDKLEISLDGSTNEWRIQRESKSLGSDQTTLEFVTVEHETGNQEATSSTFALFSRSGIPIAEHTGGIDVNTWGEVDHTRIGVALRVTNESDGTHLKRLTERPYLHVFLPTEEQCPIPVLANGAFYTKISRTSVDVTADEENYNGFLLQQIADLLATDALSYAKETATSADEILDWLDFTHLPEETRNETGSLEGRLVGALQSTFLDVPFLPRFSAADRRSSPLPLREIVVPYYAETRPQIAAYVARIHGEEPLQLTNLDSEGYFPDTDLLTPTHARILDSLDTSVLSAPEIPPVLGSVADHRSPLNNHPNRGDELAIDPILQVLIWVYETISDQDDVLSEFKSACREARVFPVGRPDTDGVVRHVARDSEDSRELFFPPKNDIPDVDLPGVAFLSPPLYRPEASVNSQTQSELVSELKPALESIWDVTKFGFEEVAQAALFPVLPSPRQQDADDTPLRNRGILELVWRLAGESVNADTPLPHIERTQTLHNLCLLPVPTKTGDWRPACRVYFGSEWQPDASTAKHVEPLFEAAEIEEAHYLAPPDTFPGIQEVGDDEDTDIGEESEFDEWRNFFRWLGVSPHVRLKPLFDPQTRRDLRSMIGIERPDARSALDALDDDLWRGYRQHLIEELEQTGGQRGEYDSIYQMQSLEFLGQFIEAAEAGTSSSDSEANSDIGEQLLDHISAWWQESFQDYQSPVLATHDVRSFGRRNQNCPSESEKRRVGLNLWLWQLKNARWCPTEHGIRRPDETWMPTESVRKRFQLNGSSLLPVLSLEVAEQRKHAAGFLDAVGVRRELSQSTFRPRDARIVVGTLSNTFTDDDGKLRSASEVGGSLRQIKSAYRYTSELLPPLTDQTREVKQTEWQESQAELADLDVLCRYTDGSFEFIRAQDAYFVNAPDVLEQVPVPNLPVFVLQETDAVGFGVHFDMRDLERSVEADPVFYDERLEVRDHLLAELERAAPYILCRLEAERQSQELITRDLNGLRAFCEELEVVDSIEVDYEFPDEDVPPVTSEPAFYLDRRDRGQGEPAKPVVRASENEDEQYRYLARAICGALDVTQFEGVVTMLTAADNRQRREYLRLAGAPSSRDEIESKRQALYEDNESGNHRPKPNPLPDEPDDERENSEDVARKPLENRTPQRQERPVYEPAELAISGDKETIIVEPSDENGEDDADDNGGTSGGGGDPDMKYRTVVDQLGMQITLEYERARLREEFDFETRDEAPDAYVFEVHTDDSIGKAREDSIASPVIEELVEGVGLPLPYPGFDILTVNPDTEEADRLIELKSSGHDTRTPGISWNEWKTARTEEVSDHFYLYIVGNLRKDIHSDPYVRTIRNPFELLRPETEERSETKREVKVDIRNFRKRGEIQETSLTDVSDSG